jgi:hypothetical protein
MKPITALIRVTPKITPASTHSPSSAVTVPASSRTTNQRLTELQSKAEHWPLARFRCHAVLAMLRAAAGDFIVSEPFLEAGCQARCSFVSGKAMPGGRLREFLAHLVSRDAGADSRASRHPCGSHHR